MMKKFRFPSAMIALLSLAYSAHTQALVSPTISSPSNVLSLASAVSKALESSPKLAESRAALSASKGAERQAGAWSNPEISVEAENVAGSGPYRATDAGEFTYSVSQKLELGKLPARRKRAASEREVVSIAMQAEKLNLIRDVKVAYGEVLTAEGQVKLTQAQQKLAEDMLTNVSRRVSAARDPLIYRTQAEVALATAKMAHAQAQRELKLAKTRLSTLWGGEPLSQSLDAKVLSTSEQPEAFEVYRGKLADNPDLTRFIAMKAAKESAVRLEKAQVIPDPNVSVGFKTFRDSKEQAMVLGVSVPLPVFDQNRGNIQRARAELDQVESEGRTATLNAEQLLQEAWQEWQSAHQEASELRENIIPNAEKAFTLSREGYERGRFSYLEILNAQRTLSEAQGQFNKSLQRQLTAKAQMERLIAGPVTNPIQQGESK